MVPFELWYGFLCALHIYYGCTFSTFCITPNATDTQQAPHGSKGCTYAQHRTTMIKRDSNALHTFDIRLMILTLLNLQTRCLCGQYFTKPDSGQQLSFSWRRFCSQFNTVDGKLILTLPVQTVTLSKLLLSWYSATSLCSFSYLPRCL